MVKLNALMNTKGTSSNKLRSVLCSFKEISILDSINIMLPSMAELDNRLLLDQKLK